jgi:Peptidase M50B-like
LKKTKFLFAFLLFPTIMAFLYETLRIFGNVALNFRTSFYFVIGFSGYFAFHYFVTNPVRMYILAHELTHAFAALLCGYKVRKISVFKKSGYAELSQSNAFVDLAPYCIPLYMLLFALLYFLISLKWDISQCRNVFVVGVGFFMGFHVLNTVEILYCQKQSDLRTAGGVFFSLVVIVLSNCMALLLVLKFLYPKLVFVGMALENSVTDTLRLWKFLVAKISKAMVKQGN